jgi:hypothetical protein
MKPLFLFLFAAFLITSCDKVQTNSTTYMNAPSATIDPAIMYVQNQRITDTATINTCLRQNGINNLLTDSSVRAVSDELLAIYFTGNNVSYTINDPVSISGHGQKTTPNDSVIVITSNVNDTLFGSYGGQTRCDTLNSIINKYKAPSYYIYVGGFVGVDLVTTPSFPLWNISGQLYIPRANEFYKSYVTNGVVSQGCNSGNVSNIWTIKSDSIQNKLSAGDTVIIQTNKILLQTVI